MLLLADLKKLGTLAFWTRVAGFSQFVWRRLTQDRCLQTAGSLTFTTMLAIVPLITIALSLFSAFPMFNSISITFRNFILSHLLPDTAGRITNLYMRHFSENTGKLTTIGMLGLTATAILLLFTIERSLNEIWGVRRSRNPIARILMYWAGMTLGPLLIGLSLSLTMQVYSSSGIASSYQMLHLILLKAGPLLLLFSSLILLYLAVPNCYVPRRHAMISALVVTLALDQMRHLFGIYIRQFTDYKVVYGAFAGFPIFLLWLYICWVIILCGAVISACLSYWPHSSWKKVANYSSLFEQAVNLLFLLADAHKSGEILHIDVLRQRAGLGIDVTYRILQTLSARSYVRGSKEGQWILAADPATITLLDIYEEIVSPLPQSEAPYLQSTTNGMRQVLAITLANAMNQRTATQISTPSEKVTA